MTRLSARHAVVLGIVQGVCEYLPVSSSAHVAVALRLLSRSEGALDSARARALEVALHAGSATVLPWLVGDTVHRVGGPARATTIAVGGLLAPVVVGVLADAHIERRAAGPGTASVGLVLGAVALVDADANRSLTDAATSRRNHPPGTVATGLILGIAQAAALMPGVSRRAATLVAARWSGYDRDDASDLSWVAGVPVMGAAAVRSTTRSARRGELRDDGPALLAGALASAATTAIVGRTRHHIDRVPWTVWSVWRVAVAAIAWHHRAPHCARR